MQPSSPRSGPLAFAAHIPFIEALGVELWSAAEGTSELRLTLDPEHMNSRNMAHGGVVMTLLDVAMAQAARTLHRAGDKLGPGVITIEMKTSFVRPSCGRLVARGKVLHRTLTMAFCEASVLDEGHHLCAHATGTFKYAGRVEKPPPVLPGTHTTHPDESPR